MPLLDLSLVTTTVLRLLRARVDPLWAEFFPPSPPPPTINYSGVSSNNLTGDQALGFFLYHANEDPHLRNQPPSYSDRPPVRFNPMGLQLHYQLVAQATDLGDPESAAIRSQRLFGLALKTLHDYSSLDRNTDIGGPVFPPELQGTDNVIRVVLRNIPPGEATSFWNPGDQPVRLAAYYDVSATLLQPDRPQLRSSRVLRYGVQVFVNGAPRLDTSRSIVTFRLPGETTDRSAEVAPGEAAIGETLKFEGSDLSGDSTSLLIKKTGWDEPQEVGLDWNLVSGTDYIQAQVRSAAGSEDIVPGVYSAAARVTRNRQMPDGSTRAFPQTSNEVPFTISPHITNPAYNVVAVAAGPQNIVSITGGVFEHAEVTPENVRVIVGPEAIPIETTAALTPGHFEIVDATQLRFRFPIAGLTSGQVLPLRIIVNGAENSTRWVQVS